MDKKTCKTCHKAKLPTEFYAHKRMASGRLNDCKECYKAKVTANRKANIEHYRKYDRERGKTPERLKNAAAQTKAWRAEDRRRQIAHGAVARAIKSGALDRGACERCGRKDAFAHHENYDKKLDVTWLCQPCHKDRHKEMAAQNIIP